MRKLTTKEKWKQYKREMFRIATEFHFSLEFHTRLSLRRNDATTRTTAATETPIVKATRDGEPRRTVSLASMKREPLAAGDEVAFVDFDQTADVAVVQRVSAFDQLGEMLEIMAELKARPATLEPIPNPHYGEVLSCRWSGPEGDESFYRAAVTKVDREKKKVKWRACLSLIFLIFLQVL